MNIVGLHQRNASIFYLRVVFVCSPGFVGKQPMCLFLVFGRGNAEYARVCREKEGEGGGENAACKDRECKKKE